MALSKEEADAFRQCLRIIAPYYDAETRRTQAGRVEQYIGEGKWIPAWHLKDISRLFYSKDKQRQSDMESKMLAAMKSNELQSTPRNQTFLASDLVGWVNCPPVPKDSPLRFWLPEFMQEIDAPSKPSTVKAVSKSSNWKISIQAQAAELWRKYRAMDGSPTKNNIKSDLAKWCRENEITTDRGIFPDEDYIYRHVLRKWTPPIR